MKPVENVLREMPDIANEVKPTVGGKLEWVGMNDIELPVRIEDDQGNMIQSTARVTAYVNLVDPDVRGIHMSRLYLHLDQAFFAMGLDYDGVRGCDELLMIIKDLFED